MQKEQTSGAAAGATDADWTHFSNHLALLPDLLPVVSNRERLISPRSHLYANRGSIGKVPSTLNAAGEVVGFTGWSKHVTRAAELERWRAEPDYGICVVGRQLKGIDIDVPDPAAAAAVRAAFEVMLGELPVRGRVNSGKVLLAVRCPVVMPKRTFKVEGGVVELLGDRQQFIVAGRHPSGARYEWTGLGDVVPEVGEADLLEAWGAVERALGIPGSGSADRRAGGQQRPRTATDGADAELVDYLWGGGWVRGEGADGSLWVVCPWEVEHGEGAGAPSSTAFWPAGVGADRRGFKCLHAHCTGRGHAEFLSAVGWSTLEVAAEFEDVGSGVAVQAQSSDPVDNSVDRPAFERDKTGGILPTARNVLTALGCVGECGARIAEDRFKGSVLIEWQDEPGAWRALRDTDYVRLQARLEGRDFRRVGKELVRDCVARVAEVNAFDSAVQWLDGLRWDGVPRCENFFVDCFGVADGPYARAVGRYAWTALAGRALEPGCKADMVPVLIGPQGAGKTTGISEIAPTEDAFVELSLDVHDDNLARKMKGKLVGELGELRGLAGKDGDAIKQWLSRRVEEWTPKYREHAQMYPRRLVLFGTGNRRDWLDDETGNRRWLPMNTGDRVDLDRIRRERDQLWAEGAVMFRGGGVDWRAAEELARAEHAGFTAYDDWEGPIAAWLDSDAMDGTDGPKRGAEPFSTAAVLSGALMFHVERMDYRASRRVGKVLHGLGYVLTPLWVDGRTQRRWVAPNK